MHKTGLYFTKRPLGWILIDGGFVSKNDIDRALDIQVETNELIGDILIRLNTLTHVELSACLALQRDLSTYEDALKAAVGNPWSLSEVLFKLERIDPHALDEALEEQRKTSEKLGLILNKRGYITDEELGAVVELHRVQAEFEQAHSPEAKRRLCDILIHGGYVTEEQLRQALEQHESSGRRLDHVLVEGGFIEHHRMEHALAILKKIFLAALVALLANSALNHPAWAAERYSAMNRSVRISVAAVVLPYIKINEVNQASEFVITHSDTKKGYVEAQSATIVEVKTNSKSGYMLNFSGLSSDPIKEVQITTGSVTSTVTSGGSSVFLVNSGSDPVTISVNYRFILSEDAHPGTYAWPITLTISAVPS